MGIIDKCTYTLSCSKCGVSEASSVLDKGSGWGGSSWGSSASFSNFITTWSGGDKEEPDLLSASCKECGASASVTSQYSQ